MMISEIEIPEGYRGLPKNRLSRLGRFVVLTGPNGGGKSRILSAVANAVSSRATEAQLDELRTRISQNEQRWLSLKSRIAAANEGNKDLIKKISEQLPVLEALIANDRETISFNERIKYVKSDKYSKATAVSYFTRNIEFSDWRDRTLHAMDADLAQAMNNVGLHGFSSQVFSAIRSLGEAHFMSKAAQLEGATKENSGVASDRYRRLSSLIEELLGESLQWDFANRGPRLFGSDIAKADLSEGQKILLLIATSLALQDASKEDLILLLDEPENHLHPAALLDVIDKISTTFRHAQIWIATHSIHLLSHFGESSIWAVSHGRAEYAGRNWRKAVTLLVGSEERIERTRGLLGLPFYAAAASFAAECVLPPQIVDTPTGDPQTEQIASLLKVACATRKMRILDYGAGQGRLLRELQSQFYNLADVIDYIAADHPSVATEYQDKCKHSLSVSYLSDAESRYVLGDDEIRRRFNAGSFDRIVLCNVLHEIDPMNWLKLFGREGIFDYCLSETGEIVIVEDHNLPDGEHAHRFNFLVLDSPELKKLFAVSPEDKSIVTYNSSDYPDRLKAHQIPRSLLSNVSRQTIANAIKELRINSEASARALMGRSDMKAARLYGFWSMQHFNATLAENSV